MLPRLVVEADVYIAWPLGVADLDCIITHYYDRDHNSQTLQFRPIISIPPLHIQQAQHGYFEPSTTIFHPTHSGATPIKPRATELASNCNFIAALPQLIQMSRSKQHKCEHKHIDTRISLTKHRRRHFHRASVRILDCGDNRRDDVPSREKRGYPSSYRLHTTATYVISTATNSYAVAYGYWLRRGSARVGFRNWNVDGGGSASYDRRRRDHGGIDWKEAEERRGESINIFIKSSNKTAAFSLKVEE